MQNVHVILTFDDLLAIAIFVIAAIAFIVVILFAAAVRCVEYVQDRVPRRSDRISFV